MKKQIQILILALLLGTVPISKADAREGAKRPDPAINNTAHAPLHNIWGTKIPLWAFENSSILKQTTTNSSGLTRSADPGLTASIGKNSFHSGLLKGRAKLITIATVTSFYPTTATAGQTVTITGTNFTGATAVTFAGINATSFSVVSATTITAVVPNLGSGQTGGVAVTVGSAASLSGFTFTACSLTTPTILNSGAASFCAGDSTLLTVNSASSQVSTFAGSGTAATTNGTGTSAAFKTPKGMAVDASGNVYVAEYGNHVIRKISPLGVVTTLAGTAGTFGFVNATGTSATFREPNDLCVDAAGNVYVADSYNDLIRKITPAGVVTTLAGTGLAVGSTDGTGSAARFYYPEGIAIDAAGTNLYIADTYNHKIRKLNITTGAVTTIAGTGSAGSADGTGTAASFNLPGGIAIDANNNLYIADTYNHKIRKITPAGVVTTVAGTGTAGSGNGLGTSASFNFPYAIEVDADGNIYPTDNGNNAVRKISPDGVVTTIAGTTATGSANGPGSSATFNATFGIALSPDGSFYVADQGNNLIRKITPYSYIWSSGETAQTIKVKTSGNYTVKTVYYACTSAVSSATEITANALPATPTITASGSTAICNGSSVTLTASSANGYIWSNGATTQSITVSLAGSYSVNTTNAAGCTSATSAVTTVTATLAPFTPIVSPSGPTTFCGGDSVTLNTTIYSRMVATVAGSGTASLVNGTGTTATFKTPKGVAADNNGNIYVADFGNNAIRKITPAGVVTTLAGGTQGSTNGTGTAAKFYEPNDLTVDAAGNVYVVDSYNDLIRKITPAGVVSTIAGTALAYGFADGTGAAARFYYPEGIAIDATGKYLYIADTYNYRIRKLEIATGIVTTVAGAGTAGTTDGTGTAAKFNLPGGIATDATGNLYIADTYNYKIRKITPAGVVSTLAGSGVAGNADGTGTAASFN